MLHFLVISLNILHWPAHKILGIMTTLLIRFVLLAKAVHNCHSSPYIIHLIIIPKHNSSTSLENFTQGYVYPPMVLQNML